MPKNQSSQENTTAGINKVKNQSDKQNENEARSQVAERGAKHTEDIAMIWKKSSLYMPQGLVVSTEGTVGCCSH